MIILYKQSLFPVAFIDTSLWHKSSTLSWSMLQRSNLGDKYEPQNGSNVNNTIDMHISYKLCLHLCICLSWYTRYFMDELW